MSKMAPGMVGVTQYASGVTVKAAKHSLSCTHLLLSRPNPLNPAACKKVQTAMSGHKLQKSVFSHMDPTIPTSAASVNYVYSRFVGWGDPMQVAFHKHVCSEGNQDWKHRASAAWLLESCLSGLGMVGIMKCCKICGEDVFSFMCIMEIMYFHDPGVIKMAPVLYLCRAL